MTITAAVIYLVHRAKQKVGDIEAAYPLEESIANLKRAVHRERPRHSPIPPPGPIRRLDTDE